MMSWLGALATYAYLPCCVYLGLARAMSATRQDAGVLAAVSLGLGPLAVSWLLSWQLAVVPGLGLGFQVALALSLFGAAAVWGLAGRPPLPRVSLSLSGPGGACLLTAGVLLALLALQAVVLPLNGNDPLEYALVAKVIWRDGSLLHYPLRQADPVTGLYAGSSHPLGYVALIVWSYCFTGGVFDGFSRSLSPFFVLALAALFLASRREDRRLHGPLAVLLLLGAPLYFQTAAIAHIDAQRLYALYLAVFCLDRATAEGGRRRGWIVLCGVCGGLSLHCHSIGLLALPFLGACLLVRRGLPLGRRLGLAVAVCALALAVGGERYVRNTLAYGSPVRDDEPVWSLPAIGYTAYNDHLKGLDSPAERLFNGVLTPLTRWAGATDNAVLFFGLSFWLALAAAAAMPRRVNDDPMAVFCLVCLGAFFALALASAALGSSLVIKNVRYFLTVLPFAAYLGAVFAAGVVSWAARRRRWAARLAVAAAILALSGATLAMNGVTLAFALPNLGRLGQGDLAYLEHAYSGEYFYPAGYQAVAWIREHAPADARVLTFRKNELAYYGGRRILADTDPALLPFYAAPDAAAAEAELRRLGVTHVFTQNYLPPTFTNSPAAVLADDPRRCELVFDRKGYRVYRLTSADAPGPERALRALAGADVWTRPAPFTPSLITELLAPALPFGASVAPCGRETAGTQLEVGPEGVYSGPGPMDLPPSASLSPAPVPGGSSCLFRAEVAGAGWLKAFVVFYLRDGGLVWDVAYDGVTRGPGGVLARQVLAPGDATEYRLLLVAGPNDRLTVSRPRLECGETPPALPAAGPAGEGGAAFAAQAGAPVWFAPDGAPDADRRRLAASARRAALFAGATRRADGVTLLEVLAGRLVGAGRAADGGDTEAVELSLTIAGQGRTDCYVTWDGGAAWAGTLAPCGREGRAALTARVPRNARNPRPLFHLQPEGEGLTIRAVRIESFESKRAIASLQQDARSQE